MRLVEDEKLKNEAEEVRVVFRMDVTAAFQPVGSRVMQRRFASGKI